MSVRKATLASGTKVWQARVMVNGQRRSALRSTYEAAKATEADLRRALQHEGAQANAAAASPGTLRDGLHGYVARLEARGKSADSVQRARQVEGVLAAALPGLLERSAAELTAEDLFAVRRARDRAGTAPSTINRDLVVVRAMLKLVRPEFHWPTGLLVPEDHTRVRMLTPKQAPALFAAMAEPGRSVARFAALTLMRLSEIRLLRREQVDLGHGLLTLPKTKTIPRVVVLSSEAQALLAAALRRPSPNGWVFPNAEDRPYSRCHLSTLFRQAARRVGLADWRFHDLRHHGASVALNAGVSGQIVRDLGGWKSEAMMRRYASLTNETLRAAAEAVAAHGAPARLALATASGNRRGSRRNDKRR